MRVVIPVLLAVAVAHFAGATSTSEFLSFDGSEVPDIGAANLQSVVEDSDDPLVLMMTSSQCGKMCGDFRERLEKVSTSLQGMVKFAATDVGSSFMFDGDDVPVAQFFNVSALPTVVIYPPGQKTVQEAMQINPNYTIALVGQAKESQVSEFFLQFLENNVKSVKNGNHKDWNKENEEKGRLLLFTKQKKTPPILKRLSMDFKATIAIGDVHEAQNEVVEKYKVTNFPQIMFKSPSKKKWVKYDGPLKYHEIRRWLEEKNVEVPIPALNKRTEVLDHCSNKGGVCLIGMFEGSDVDDDKNVLQSVARRSWKGGLLNWSWVNIEGRQALADAFEMVAFPTLLAINPRKNRYAVLQGAYNPSEVRKFVVGVFDGSAKLRTIERGTPSLEDLVANLNKEDL